MTEQLCPNGGPLRCKICGEYKQRHPLAYGGAMHWFVPQDARCARAHPHSGPCCPELAAESAAGPIKHVRRLLEIDEERNAGEPFDLVEWNRNVQGLIDNLPALAAALNAQQRESAGRRLILGVDFASEPSVSAITCGNCGATAIIEPAAPTPPAGASQWPRSGACQLGEHGICTATGCRCACHNTTPDAPGGGDADGIDLESAMGALYELTRSGWPDDAGAVRIEQMLAALCETRVRPLRAQLAAAQAEVEKAERSRQALRERLGISESRRQTLEHKLKLAEAQVASYAERAEADLARLREERDAARRELGELKVRT